MRSLGQNSFPTFWYSPENRLTLILTSGARPASGAAVKERGALPRQPDSAPLHVKRPRIPRAAAQVTWGSPASRVAVSRSPLLCTQSEAARKGGWPLSEVSPVWAARAICGGVSGYADPVGRGTRCCGSPGGRCSRGLRPPLMKGYPSTPMHPPNPFRAGRLMPGGRGGTSKTSRQSSRLRVPRSRRSRSRPLVSASGAPSPISRTPTSSSNVGAWPRPSSSCKGRQRAPHETAALHRPLH
jgi:hypothetical protein